MDSSTRRTTVVLNVAGLTIEVEPYASGFQAFAGSYGSLVESDARIATCDLRIATCDLRIAVTAEMIEAERRMADSSNYSDGYLQTLVVYRQIAEAAPKFGRLLIHAAVIEYAGKAYAFTAPSGTGKSTHVRLWREVFGDAVTVINGDKPLLRARKPGVARLDCDAAQSGCSDVRASGETVQVIAYGTPWCGKEGWNTNIGAPLAGICLLQQGSKNACVRETPAAALDWMCRQVYMPRDAGAGVLTLELLDALLAEVPLYRLTCDMSRDAVRASFQAMTGLDFDACARRNDGGE